MVNNLIQLLASSSDAFSQRALASTLPLLVEPNAGLPKEVENRRIYLCSPEYLAEYAKRYVALGVSAVGGCCGTTPDHIREVALAVKPDPHQFVA